jgi:hypothetical protein
MTSTTNELYLRTLVRVCVYGVRIDLELSVHSWTVVEMCVYAMHTSTPSDTRARYTRRAYAGGRRVGMQIYSKNGVRQFYRAICSNLCAWVCVCVREMYEEDMLIEL